MPAKYNFRQKGREHQHPNNYGVYGEMGKNKEEGQKLLVHSRTEKGEKIGSSCLMKDGLQYLNF